MVQTIKGKGACALVTARNSTLAKAFPMMEAVEVEDGLKEDSRWQLIERILATGPFQKSGRLRGLLR
jgi:hypothetical protein